MMPNRGYDMTPTMYSPDGRIYQVEYALETVKRGTLAVGIKSKEGVIIAVEEKSRILQVSDVTQKIFQIDEHIGAAAAGYIPDARVQVDNARYFSQSNKLTYDEPVEIETVKRGTLAIGLQAKDGVVIAVEEKPRNLQVSETTQKIFQIDEHIGVAAAGYIPDARVQVDNARFFAQSNKLTYDEPVEIETVAKHLADQSHQFTQYSGVRPFGVALIIAGVDRNGSRIYVTDPSGTYVLYAAVAIGGNSDDITTFLEKNYNKDMSVDDVASLAIAAINLKSEEKGVSHIKMSKIKLDTKLLERISNEELEKYGNIATEKFAK